MADFTGPQETFSFSHSAAKLWPYLIVRGLFLSFFLFKQQTQRKHWWEEKYMLQIKMDADSNLLHREVSYRRRSVHWELIVHNL